MIQIQEFNNFVEQISKPLTYSRILSEIQVFGNNTALKPQDLPVFYLELCISLNIMYTPTGQEKREMLLKCGGDISLTKQTLLFVFIKNNF